MASFGSTSCLDGSRCWLVALAMTILLSLPGCGGGTRGTGATIEGRLSFSDSRLEQEPLGAQDVAGVEVTVTVFRGGEAIDGAQDITATDGSFAVVVTEFGDEVTFEFRSSRISADVLVPSSVEQSNRATVEFRVNTGGDVSLAAVDFGQGEVPKETSTPTPASSGQQESSSGSFPESTSGSSASSGVTSPAPPKEESGSSQGTEEAVEEEGSTEETGMEESGSSEGSTSEGNVSSGESSSSSGQENSASTGGEEGGASNPGQGNSSGENGSEGNSGGESSGEGQGPSTVTICHTTGNQSSTLEIPEAALQGHLNHGDTLGACS